MGPFVFYNFLLTFLYRVHPTSLSSATARRPGTRIAGFHSHQLKMVIIISDFNRLIFHCAEYIYVIFDLLI